MGKTGRLTINAGSISGIGPNTSGTWAVSLDQMAKKLTAAAHWSRGNRREKRRWQKVVDDEPLSESYYTGSHDYAEGAGYRFALAHGRDQECNRYLRVPIFERSKIFVELFYFLSFFLSPMHLELNINLIPISVGG